MRPRCISAPIPTPRFFEDWSAWRDLGGGCHDDPPARRNQPLYWCQLLLDVHDLGGQPGFALRVPQDAGVTRLLRLCGGVQGKPRPAYRGATSTRADMEAMHRWFVPAGRWRDLRKHLPAVRAIIKARAAKYGRPTS